ncbi:proton-coupled amino acid transporter-like protein pathetic [Diprion similis]|uniref:proton-coupled amino acid transporter-like protein pathetic n=1 Tax=Diprion similis TaxID=362088 RepID=UPI001EF973C6|nr:proton-coupled amino acid transporter-like protein pathetic [Diprion similis]
MYTNFFAMPVYCTIFLFAIHNMCILMPLENSMKTPDHLPIILVISMTFSSTLYLLFGLLGYNKYVNPCDTVIKNLPLDDPVAQAVKIAIAVSVMFGYGIHYFVPVSIIWPQIMEKVNEDKRRIFEIVFRIGGVIVTILVAVALPKLGPLLGLFAALCFSSMALLLPGIIDLATSWEGSKNPKTLLVKNILLFILWIVLLVIGCFESIKQMVEEYGTVKTEDSIC